MCDIKPLVHTSFPSTVTATTRPGLFVSSCKNTNTSVTVVRLENFKKAKIHCMW